MFWEFGWLGDQGSEKKSIYSLTFRIKHSLNLDFNNYETAYILFFIFSNVHRVKVVSGCKSTVAIPDLRKRSSGLILFYPMNIFYIIDVDSVFNGSVIVTDGVNSAD